MNEMFVIKKPCDAGNAFVARRDQIGLKQREMLLKIGMVQQQYQPLESGKDMKLSTLLRIAEGLNLDLMLVPRENQGAGIVRGVQKEQISVHHPVVNDLVQHLSDEDEQ